MLGLKPFCPHCKHAVAPNTTRCPHCKNTIPKKNMDRFKKAENMFWVVFLAGFILFLIVPLILWDFLGSKWTVITIISGIPISFLAGFLTRVAIVSGIKKEAVAKPGLSKK